MTEFCDFIPDDPSCTDANTGGDNGTSDGGVDDGGIIDNGANDINTGDDVGDQETDVEAFKPEVMTWERFEQKANAHFNPTAGNFAYLSLAGLNTYVIFKRAFIDYLATDKTDAQTASGTGNTNYYDLMWKIQWYSGLV